MSGSPIYQNGKIVGAASRVLANAPIRGYGIFIENALEATGEITGMDGFPCLFSACNAIMKLREGGAKSEKGAGRDFDYYRRVLLCH